MDEKCSIFSPVKICLYVGKGKLDNWHQLKIIYLLSLPLSVVSGMS